MINEDLIKIKKMYNDGKSIYLDCYFVILEEDSDEAIAEFKPKDYKSVDKLINAINILEDKIDDYISKQ